MQWIGEVPYPHLHHVTSHRLSKLGFLLYFHILVNMVYALGSLKEYLGYFEEVNQGRYLFALLN